MPLPKLNLRDLFWLVVVVAVGLGWWQDRQVLRRRALETERELDRRKLHDELRANLDRIRGGSEERFLVDVERYLERQDAPRP